MVLKCYLTGHNMLEKRGVVAVIDCPIDGYSFRTTSDLQWLIKDFIKKLDIEGKIVFDSNEAIGTTHILYRYHVLLNDEYIGVRLVSRENSVYRVLFTIPRKELLGKLRFKKYDPLKDMKPAEYRSRAPGQYYVPNLVVYASLGMPRDIDLSTWRLELSGLVENPLSLRLSDLYAIGIKTIKINFHCATGWSVREVEFTGPALGQLIKRVKPSDSVKWVYVESLDGYSTIIPYSEALRNNVLVALEMNRRPLDPEHGYPARLVIPHLYGWKSAKWVYRIVFIDEYRDGYWEALGYHPRGRVDLEERFKKT